MDGGGGAVVAAFVCEGCSELGGQGVQLGVEGGG